MSNKPSILHYHGSTSRHGGPQKVIELMMNSRLVDSYEMHICAPQLNGIYGVNATVSAIKESILQYKPDLLHIRGLMLHGFRGVYVGRIMNTKTLLSIHGSSRDSVSIPLWKKMLLTTVLEPLSLHWATGVISVCHAMNNRTFLKKYLGKNLGVVHNGIPIRNVAVRDPATLMRLNIPLNAVVGLCACRLTSDKGVHILFDAFEKLYALRNNFHLIVAGDGDYMKQAKGRVASSDWGGNVKLLGHQDNIANLHAVSDFFIMPTLHENLSNALLEAMHESKAIITTSVGGNSEVVVDEATGLLIPPSDVEALVKSVIRLIDNPPECNQFGLNGRKRVIEHFAFDAFIDNIDSVYRKLLG